MNPNSRFAFFNLVKNATGDDVNKDNTKTPKEIQIASPAET